MLERVKQFLGMAPKKVGNQLVISCEKLERRVALLEDGVLEKRANFYVTLAADIETEVGCQVRRMSACLYDRL